MQDNVMISVRDLKKRFKVYNDKSNSLKEKLLFFKRNRYEDRWVLNGISFDIHRGEAIALVGENGCGKSTTLKLLTKIMYPTSGKIAVKGRVSCMIELGAGFHPDMSGRENIYTNASIFGLTKRQIDERVDDIIAFSEMEEFLDNPVRTYSSGMYMRLAFSVAINVEADILLIDEILAVGDASFQKKCFEKLKEIKRNGTTIVIVSHALDQIEEICDRTIWIRDGKLHMDGPAGEVHREYMKKMEEDRMAKAREDYINRVQALNEEAGSSASNRKKENLQELQALQGEEAYSYFCGKRIVRLGRREICFKNVVLFNGKQEMNNVFSPDEPMTIEMEYENKENISRAVFGIRIYNEENILCFGTDTDVECGGSQPVGPSGTASVKVDRISLQGGKYYLDLDIYNENGEAMDILHEAVDFYIEQQKETKGIASIHTEWTVK